MGRYSPKIKFEKKCLEKISIFMRFSDLLNYICGTIYKFGGLIEY